MSENLQPIHPGKLETLTRAEHEEFGRLESRIRDGIARFIEVGEALATIRDKRLYRATHHNFSGYVAERWSMDRSYAYRLIKAAGHAQSSIERGEPAPKPDYAARKQTVKPKAEGSS